MQRVGILTCHPQLASPVVGDDDADRQLVAAGLIWFHKQLQFFGIDEQHGVIVGKLPGLAVGGPLASNELNVASSFAIGA